MTDEDDIPRKPAETVRRNLEPMSVGELESYIGDLEAEIARVRADIKTKQSHLMGADALFRKAPPE